MSGYQLTWITSYLAVGYAPMSYAELDSIKSQGVSTIVNLCGEFCDLHEIEEQSGFEVYFLPIPDEYAPDMEEMEKALEWLDEAVYLGKKVLVHCRHGIGRTGTFVTAYLLRRGLGLKVASKKLKKTRANPTNYAQWRLLKKYGKKTGILTIREPSLEQRHIVDLSDFFAEYEALVQDVEERLTHFAQSNDGLHDRCGRDHDACCRKYFELKMIEAVYLTSHLNKTLKVEERAAAGNRAVALFQQIRKQVRARENLKTSTAVTGEEEMQAIYAVGNLRCPLNVEGRCVLYAYRPIRCRLADYAGDIVDRELIEDVLSSISRNLFFALSGVFPEKGDLLFSNSDTVSGRFVQIYFNYLASL